MKRNLRIIILVAVLSVTALLSAKIAGERNTVIERPVESIEMYEAPIEVEQWMTETFITIIDSVLEVEEWMTIPFNV
jgi:hypothetical protein